MTLQMTLGYLQDVFSTQNELNRSLHGIGMDIFTAYDKIEAFKLKLPLQKNRVQSGYVCDFPYLKTVSEDTGSGEAA